LTYAKRRQRVLPTYKGGYNEMTTTTRSIKSISASCKKIRKSKARGRCVKHAKALRSGKSNYMTYKG
jgi:hypothetical protein